MKTLIQVKEPGDSASDAARVTHTTAPALSALSQPPLPESLQTHQDIREMMQRRYTTPFHVVFPYQHGGLNE
ncbi:MAG: hypothetical protein EXS35_09930 [Pedosphaera sp.]|nr:hypothetical protein [Pedosphaera sp.]